MIYTAYIGRYEMAHPYATNATFILMHKVQIDAPSAFDARCRAEAMYPALHVDRIN